MGVSLADDADVTTSRGSLPFLSLTHAKRVQAIKEKPVVLFMKGTPRIPQCGFSRAVCQILEVQGVPMDQVKTYNVLEDQELRDAIKEYRCVETLSEECGSCVGYDPAPWLPTRTTSPSASRTPSHEHLEKNTNG